MILLLGVRRVCIMAPAKRDFEGVKVTPVIIQIVLNDHKEI